MKRTLSLVALLLVAVAVFVLEGSGARDKKPRELVAEKSSKEDKPAELDAPERIQVEQIESASHEIEERDFTPARQLSAPELARLISPIEYVDPSALDEVLAMVTPEGLFERTADWWDQEDFLALTGDELARLVPDAESYAFGGSRTLRDFIGGLPTIEDCERAFESEGVRRELASVAAKELPINALGMTPNAERDEKWQADFDALLADYHAAELSLAGALERASGYAHWSVLCRAFGAWNQ